VTFERFQRSLNRQIEDHPREDKINNWTEDRRVILEGVDQHRQLLDQQLPSFFRKILSQFLTEYVQLLEKARLDSPESFGLSKEETSMLRILYDERFPDQTNKALSDPHLVELLCAWLEEK